MQMNRETQTRLVLVLLVLLGGSACAGPMREREVFAERGIRVGIQHDPTIDRMTPPALNSHSARLTPEEVRSLLGSLQVSGYSGTLMGLIATPRPSPLFKDEELQLLAAPIADALAQAGPQDRVFFSVPDLAAPYNEDRTEGMLFLRGPYLHLVLTDHNAITRADTAGGEDLKDPRDTKGMQLWVANPAKAATLSPGEAPRWGAFEKVHISFNVQETLTARAASPGLPQAAAPKNAPLQRTESQPDAGIGPGSSAQGESPVDLRLQIRELTSSNLELRARLEEQARQMESLKEELARLQRELEKTNPNAQSRRKTPSP